MDDLLFGKIEGLTILDKNNAVNSVLNINSEYSFWDDYRSTKMIHLMSKNGRMTRNDEQGDFHWTPWAPKIIIDWFENIVFPWLGMKARIMALITQPNFSNTEHIDCQLKELNTRQHKFRIVLQGKTDTLYFKTQNGDVYAPEIEEPFIMDGGWPHGMNNFSNKPKVTLALGSPWKGKDNYDDVKVMMRRSDYLMPNDLSEFWKKI